MWNKYKEQLNLLKYPNLKDFKTSAMQGFEEFVGTQEQLNTERMRREDKAQEDFRVARAEYRKATRTLYDQFHAEILKEYGCSNSALNPAQKEKINRMVLTSVLDESDYNLVSAFEDRMEFVEEILEVATDADV